MMGPGGSWDFDERAAREMADRGIRAVPTVAADTRAQRAGAGWADLSTTDEAHRVPIRMANARALRDAGVTIIPGTDGLEFEEAIHLELEAYAATGIAPLELIRAATLDSARHLGVEAQTGSIEAGKAADILVVGGSADTDIAALRQPLVVFARGRRYRATPPGPGPGPLTWGREAIPDHPAATVGRAATQL